METRFEQILRKIRLSKVIDMDFVLWDTTIDVNTVGKLKELNYCVEEEHFGRFYVISW